MTCQTKLWLPKITKRIGTRKIKKCGIRPHHYTYLRFDRMRLIYIRRLNDGVAIYASHFVLSMALQWEASFSDFLGSEVPKISLTGRCNTCGGGESSPILILFARHFLSLPNSFCKWLPPSRLLPLIPLPLPPLVTAAAAAARVSLAKAQHSKTGQRIPFKIRILLWDLSETNTLK